MRPNIFQKAIDSLSELELSCDEKLAVRQAPVLRRKPGPKPDSTSVRVLSPEQRQQVFRLMRTLRDSREGLSVHEAQKLAAQRWDISPASAKRIWDEFRS
jgi:hypothetical protein